jgi:8-oxo-dGTP pyrophosphatase MutT (NUDIX family)
MNIKYAATLAFSQDLRKVALIKKNRPEWLAGKWNAIGGNVDPGEHPASAASRELREEAGVYVEPQDLLPFARIDWHGASSCMMYVAIIPGVEFAQTKTDEQVMVWDTSTLPAYRGQLSDDLCALVEMAGMALRSPGNVFFVQQVTR